jgi:excisionase family DNA binding protein
MTLITVKELAKQLGVAEITIHRWKKDKGLPFKKIGHSIRFEADEVFEWMEKTDSYPKVKKFLTKIVDKKTGKEIVHESTTFEEHAKYLIKAIENKTPEQEFFIAEQMED